MHFLLLTQYFPPEVGAAQTRLMALARQLQERGHGVVVVTAMPNYPTGIVDAAYRDRFVVTELMESVAVIRTWIYAATGTSVSRRLAHYFSFCCTSLLGCLKAPKPDYILVESPPLFLAATALLVGLVRRAPVIVIVSDLWPASARELGFISNRGLLWLAERFERFVYRSAFRIGAVTEGIRDTIASVVGPAKVSFLPNGVDTELFRPDVDTSSGVLQPGQVGFIYAGTHSYYQGLDVILDAAEEVRDLHNVVFSFVGDGPDKERLTKAAAARGLANVRFYGPRSLAEMPALFAESRASIAPFRDLPLFQGGRPAKIFPSLACATPVIFSGAGEMARVLQEGRCGLVVPPERPAALADAIRLLAADATLARSLGDAGRKLVEREYSWPTVVHRWLVDLPARGL